MSNREQVQHERYAEVAREAIAKLAESTLSTNTHVDTPERLLESLTRMLSDLPQILKQLGEWHQQNADRASPRAAALGRSGKPLSSRLSH